MKRIKVGMISSSYPRNKNDFAGVFVRSLAEHISELGHEVHVLAARDPDLRPDEMVSKVHMHYFPYAPSKRLHVLGYGRSLQSDVKLRKLAFAMIPFYLVSAALHLISLATREKLDVLHAHWVIPSGPVAALVSRLLNIPLIVSLHGSDVYLLDSNRLFKKIAATSLVAAETVTACSDDLRNRTVAAGVPEEKVVVVPYGVDAEAFSPDVLDASIVTRIRGQFLGENGGVVVLALGRLVKKKGFEYLIRAIPQVAALHPDTRFVIAGDGDERERLERLVHEMNVEGSVLFPGPVAWHMIPYYLAACDSVVVPSIRDDYGNVDGLPNVLLEAMAAGKPVIASSVAGIPAVVRDGREGYLVEERSATGIAAALDRCLASRNLREILGNCARQRVFESYTWAGVASKILAFYEEAMHI